MADTRRRQEERNEEAVRSASVIDVSDMTHQVAKTRKARRGERKEEQEKGKWKGHNPGGDSTRKARRRGTGKATARRRTATSDMKSNKKGGMKNMNGTRSKKGGMQTKNVSSKSKDNQKSARRRATGGGAIGAPLATRTM